MANIRKFFRVICKNFLCLLFVIYGIYENNLCILDCFGTFVPGKIKKFKFKENLTNFFIFNYLFRLKTFINSASIVQNILYIFKLA